MNFFWLCCDSGNMKNRSPWIISDQEDSIFDQHIFFASPKGSSVVMNCPKKFDLEKSL